MNMKKSIIGIYVIIAFILVFSLTGHASGKTPSVDLDIDSDICVNTDLNITDPLDDIVVVVPDNLTEHTDPVHGLITNLTPEDPSLDPELLDFEEEDRPMITHIRQGARTGITTSPVILQRGIGRGIDKTVDVVPDDTRERGQNGMATVSLLLSRIDPPISNPMPSQNPEGSPSMKVSSHQFLATTMAGILIMGFASVFSSRHRPVEAFPVFIPLYSRIDRDEVLENPTRSDIYQLIALNPGMDLLSIKSALGLSNGVVAHHIHTLERERYLRSVRDGRHRRFFVSGTKVEAESSIERIILTEIASNPSTNQSQLARNLNMSRQSLNYHIRKLVHKGVVARERNGRETLLKRRDS